MFTRMRLVWILLGVLLTALALVGMAGAPAVTAEPAAPSAPAYQTPYPTPPPLVNTITGFEGPGLCNPTGDPSYQLNLGYIAGQNNLCFTVDTIAPAEAITIQWNPTTALQGTADYVSVTAPAGCTAATIAFGSTGTGVGTTSTYPTLQPIGTNTATKTATYQCSAASGQWKFCVNNGDGTGGAWNEFAVKVANGGTFAYGRLASKDWGYTNGSYCPGCAFDYTVVANCGSEIHVPLDDYENMVNLQVFAANGNPAPDGSWYVRRQNPAIGWCTYAIWDAALGRFKYNPDDDDCAGLQNNAADTDVPHCLPADDTSGCAVPPSTWPITVNPNAVSWLGSRMFATNQCNSTSYACIPSNNGILYGSTNEACDYESPGGDDEMTNPTATSSTDGGPVMDVVIDLEQIGCGPIRLKADAGTTGFNWEMGANCNGSLSAGGTDAFSIYFTGAGVTPTQAVNPKPELSLKNFTVQATEATACTPGQSYTSQIIATATAENLSCGDAANVPVVFDVTSGTGLSDQTQTVTTLNAFGETVVSANLGTITCVCDSPQMISITASVDPANTITECSESSATGEPVCNPPVGSANSQTASSACNALPLAITLADFNAIQQGEQVVVSWETATELNNRGFNLYRGVSPDAWDRQLNSTLIPSQAQGSAGGFLYTWDDQTDFAAGQTYWYWLQDMDVNGHTTLHGPISVVYTAPTAVRVVQVGSTSSAQPPTSALWALLLPWLGAALWLARRRTAH